MLLNPSVRFYAAVNIQVISAQKCSFWYYDIGFSLAAVRQSWCMFLLAHCGTFSIVHALKVLQSYHKARTFMQDDEIIVKTNLVAPEQNWPPQFCVWKLFSFFWKQLSLRQMLTGWWHQMNENSKISSKTSWLLLPGGGQVLHKKWHVLEAWPRPVEMTER